MLLPVAFLIGSKSLENMWYAFPIAEIFALIVAILFFINLVKTDFKKLDSIEK